MEIIYFYDALCGWCYGFSKTIELFAKKHADSFTINVVSGGMVTGDRVKPIGQIAPYIKKALVDVEKTTNVYFGEKFINETLQKGEVIFDSTPPSVALTVFKHYLPSKQLEYANNLQKAIYYTGIAPTNKDYFAQLAGNFGLDAIEFFDACNAPQMLKKTKEEFKFASSLGISGFPTVMLKANNKHYIIARGAVGIAQLEHTFNAICKQIESININQTN